MSDVYYITGFLFFFIGLAVAAPLINAEFGSDLAEGQNVAGVLDGADESSLTGPTILFNLVLIPLYTFGLPLWFNLTFMLVVRVVFLFVVWRNVWPGGGG